MTRAPDLNTAVDALIQRTRIKVYREDTQKHIWQTIPSLWEQLEMSAMWRGGGSSGAGTFGSRPTISTGVVSLIIDVSTAASEGAQEHAGKAHRSVPGNLRAIAAKLMVGKDLDQLDWWQTSLQRWARDARAELKLDPVRPRFARGIHCPDCGADTATTEQDGETVRTPAIAITWTGPDDDEHHPDTDWKVRAVECRVCAATWWRGPDLDRLVSDMLQANKSREIMAG